MRNIAGKDIRQHHEQKTNSERIVDDNSKTLHYVQRWKSKRSKEVSC